MARSFKDRYPKSTETVHLGTFLHPAGEFAVLKLEHQDVPYPNSTVLLASKPIGRVDEVFGPLGNAYVSVKLDGGVGLSELAPEAKLECYSDKFIPKSRLLPREEVEKMKERTDKSSRPSPRGHARGDGGFGRGRPSGSPRQGEGSFGRPQNRNFDRSRNSFDRSRNGFDRPNRTFDKPGRSFDRSDRNFDKSERSCDKSERNFDKPNRNFDKPNRNFDKPNRDFDRPRDGASKSPRDRSEAGRKEDFRSAPRKDFRKGGKPGK